MISLAHSRSQALNSTNNKNNRITKNRVFLSICFVLACSFASALIYRLAMADCDDADMRTQLNGISAGHGYGHSKGLALNDHDVPNDANTFSSGVNNDQKEGEGEEGKNDEADDEADDEDEKETKKKVEMMTKKMSESSGRYTNLPDGDAKLPCAGAPRELLPFEKERGSRRRILENVEDGEDRRYNETISFDDDDDDEEEDDVKKSAVVVGYSNDDEENENDDAKKRRRQRRRNLLHRGIGFTMGKAGCGKELYVRVVHENDGPGTILPKRVLSNEGALNECLTSDPTTCRDKDSLAAAKKLPGVRGLKKLPKVGLSPILGKGKKFGSCAIVGNAGHLMTKPYGKYIDAHDVVVRFNILPTTGFEKNVGSKTTLRVLNGRRSIALCCRGNFPEGKAGNEETGVMIWFPAAQGDILSACKKRFPNNPRFALPLKLSKSLAIAMNKLRTDASRLGLTGFTQWRQMTSGAHAVLLFSQLCDTVNVYGFGSFPASEKAPDQYGGRVARARSGTIWHDWSGEKNVNKLLHAAEVINVCSA